MIRTIFTSAGLTRVIISIVSENFGNVVGSASPLRAMSFSRNLSFGTESNGGCRAISPDATIAIIALSSDSAVCGSNFRTAEAVVRSTWQ